MRRAAGFAFSVLLAATAAAAQEVPAVPPGPEVATPSSILTIDQDRLYSGTKYGQAVQARLEAEAISLQAEYRRIESDLEAEERALTEWRAQLPAAEFRTLADAFDAKVTGIRRTQDAKSRALTQQRDEARQTFFKTAIPALAQLMGEMGAEAILDKSAVVLAFDRIDVTDRAIESIDASLGDGSPPPK